MFVVSVYGLLYVFRFGFVCTDSERVVSVLILTPVVRFVPRMDIGRMRWVGFQQFDGDALWVFYEAYDCGFVRILWISVQKSRSERRVICEAHAGSRPSAGVSMQ